MIVHTPGWYPLTKPQTIELPHGYYILHTGELIEVTEIDHEKQMALVPLLGGWVRWDLPVSSGKEGEK